MSKQTKIIASWSMREFFLNNGKRILRVPCTNRATGEDFNMLQFGSKFVGFSKSLGELSDKEVNKRKNDLQVVELVVPDDVREARIQQGLQPESYRLCEKGETSWEEVEITGW